MNKANVADIARLRNFHEYGSLREHIEAKRDEAARQGMQTADEATWRQRKGEYTALDDLLRFIEGAGKRA